MIETWRRKRHEEGKMDFVKRTPDVSQWKKSDQVQAFYNLVLNHDLEMDKNFQTSTIKMCGMATHIPASGLPFRPKTAQDVIEDQMNEVMSNISGQGE